MAVGTDKYSNILTQEVECSGANTLTFEEVNIGLSLFDKVGLLISRIEYHIKANTISEMTAADDNVQGAITTTNQMSTLDPAEQAVIDKILYLRTDQGTAGDSHFHTVPMVRDFAEIAGGGLLVTPKPLYLGVTSSGLASAATVTFRLFFTILKLKPEEYFELLETRQYFG